MYFCLISKIIAYVGSIYFILKNIKDDDPKLWKIIWGIKLKFESITDSLSKISIKESLEKTYIFLKKLARIFMLAFFVIILLFSIFPSFKKYLLDIMQYFFYINCYFVFVNFFI